MPGRSTSTIGGSPGPRTSIATVSWLTVSPGFTLLQFSGKLGEISRPGNHAALNFLPQLLEFGLAVQMKEPRQALDLSSLIRAFAQCHLLP